MPLAQCRATKQTCTKYEQTFGRPKIFYWLMKLIMENVEVHNGKFICAFSRIKFQIFLGVVTEKFEYLGIGSVDFDSNTRFRKVIKFY